MITASIQHNGVEPRRRLPLWFLRGWPHLVWFLAGVIAFLLWNYGARFGGMKGVIMTISEPVAPVETARLISVEVETGQPVQPGDVIARFDTTLLDAEIALNEAQWMDAETTLTGYQQSILQAARQYETALQDTENMVLMETLRQQQDIAERHALQDEMNRLEDLLNRGLIDAAALGAGRPRLAALQTAVEARSNVINRLAQHLVMIRGQRDEAEQWLQGDTADSLTAAMRRQQEAQAAIMNAAREHQEIRRASYTLRARGEGIISRIYFEPGDVVPAGGVVTRIVQTTSSRVEGFLPEEYLAEIRPGQSFEISRATGRSQRYEAHLIAISPEVATLPARLSPIPSQPLRGRRVMLELQEETDLIPGESVRIRPTRIRLGWW